MITAAYVGFGVSVREYHIPYVEKDERIRIKYVFRRKEDISQNEAYEPFYPEIAFTTDFEEILKDDEVNLVVVSAPDEFHVPYAKRILEAGKHALIEKPFSKTSQEAREVFDLAKEKGLICMPNQNRRFDADFLALKEVLESGKIGRLVRLESHYDYFKENGWYDHLGTLYNLGVHTIDQVISLLGMPDGTYFDVRSIHHPGVGDDYYDLEFYYGNAKASVHTSMCVLLDYPRFTMHGTKGSFTLPPVIHNSGKKKEVGRHVIRREPAPQERWGTLCYKNEAGETVTEKVPVGCARYEKIYDSLIGAIEQGEEKCVKDEEVIKVLEILEEATETAKSHKQ
ncbi:oxidoreductase [Petralouisia muris]|jgi:predicted dehydrogenase|uniref:Oxidoreductase n=1 Tax=Petralouisia muris TaxID=3032872 RepID=A0AC61RPR1_9FIRM|nr:Gfo/Idh/MocA family oxidoreductase [Petralouisia muris]TGY90919.1 oxidoreductase [Petralouisia muris]